MSSPSFDLPAGALTKAAFDRRWVAMASSGVDLQTIATWDRLLPRTRRVLVPVDVQAYVVPAGGGEPVVAVSGGPEDPEPLQAGASGEPGVHLHWAMPDALVTGRHDTATGDLVLPELPDRFVVLRQLYPVGSRTVQRHRLGAGRPLRHGGAARRLHGHVHTGRGRARPHAARRHVRRIAVVDRHLRRLPQPVRAARPADRPAEAARPGAGRLRRRPGVVHRRRLVERHHARPAGRRARPGPARVGARRPRLVGLARRQRRPARRAGPANDAPARPAWAGLTRRGSSGDHGPQVRHQHHPGRGRRTRRGRARREHRADLRRRRSDPLPVDAARQRAGGPRRRRRGRPGRAAGRIDVHGGVRSRRGRRRGRGGGARAGARPRPAAAGRAAARRVHLRAARRARAAGRPCRSRGTRARRRDSGPSPARRCPAATTTCCAPRTVRRSPRPGSAARVVARRRPTA